MSEPDWPALIQRYLLARGHEIGRGREIKIACPFHEDGKPSCRVDLEGAQWYCDPCGKGGLIVELVAALEGVDKRRAFEILDGAPSGPLPARRVVPPRDERRAAVDLAGPLREARDLDHPKAQPHLEWVAREWNVTRPTLDRFGVGMRRPEKRTKAGENPFELVCPSFKGGALSGIKLYRPRARELGGEKCMSIPGSKPALFGAVLLGEVAGKVLLVTGGEKDALVAAAALPDLPVVAHAGGESAWKGSVAPELAVEIVAAKPARIVVALDVNEGDRGCPQAVGALRRAGAGSVRVVAWPDDFAQVLPKGGVAQFILDPRWGPVAFRKLIDDAPGGDPVSNAPTSSPAPQDREKPRKERLTELGNSRRFVRHFGSQVRFCRSIADGWLSWDGRRWDAEGASAAMRLAKEVPALLLDESRRLSRRAKDASAAERKSLTEKAAALLRHSIKTETERQLRALLKLAETDPAVEVHARQLDADPLLLNVANGTLDLRTGALHPHAPEDLITRLAPVAFDPGASCPLWASFVDRITGGDAALATFLQRAVGYSLTGETSEQVLLFLHGSGANGKSTFLETVRAMLGDYAAQAGFATFLAKPVDNGPRNEIARLRGARLVTAVEAKERGKLDEVLVKQLTGSDTVTARFLYREEFEFRPSFKLFLAGNHKPTIEGADEGIWRRIRLVPFTVTFADDATDPAMRKDPDLGRKLLGELPGILRWAVEGCLAWRQHGLGAPPEVKRATAEYRLEEDELAAFLGEVCVRTHEGRVPGKALYSAYQEWAAANGEKPLGKKAITTRLKGRGLESRRGGARGETVWHGLSLRDDDAVNAHFEPSSTSSSHGGVYPKPGPTETSSLSELSEPFPMLVPTSVYVLDPDREEH